MSKSRTMDDLLSALTESLNADDLLAADLVSDISSAITKRRISMGLSQKDLAKKIGKTQGTISKWENGDMNFTIELLAEIATKLDMDLSVKLRPPQVIQTNGDYRTVNSKVISFDKTVQRYFSRDFELKEM